MNDAQEQLDAANAAVSHAETELAAVAAQRMKADAEDANRLDQLAQQVTEQNGKVSVLRDRLRESSTIDSPVDGIVGEVDARDGSVVAEGEVLMTIRTHTAEFEALSFIPAGQGKLVLPGMAAHLAPEGVNKDEFGTIRGKVRAVSDYPVSQRTVTELLHNNPLVAAFFREVRRSKCASPSRPTRTTPAALSGGRARVHPSP